MTVSAVQIFTPQIDQSNCSAPGPTNDPANYTKLWETNG